MTSVNKAHPINSPNSPGSPHNPISRQLGTFILRWIVSSFAMWVCIRLFASAPDGIKADLWTYLLAGFIFSAINSVLKPFITLLSLPFIVVTLGLFILFINAAMVGITIWLLPDIYISAGGAILSAITISVINYLVNFLVPSYNKK